MSEKRTFADFRLYARDLISHVDPDAGRPTARLIRADANCYAEVALDNTLWEQVILLRTEEDAKSEEDIRSTLYQTSLNTMSASDKYLSGSLTPARYPLLSNPVAEFTAEFQRAGILIDAKIELCVATRSLWAVVQGNVLSIPNLD